MTRHGSELSIVVATSGCFDVLTEGHVRLLEEAKALGTRLVVFVNTDEYVRRTKGEGRPVNPLRARMAVLKALRCVDDVLPFSEQTPCEALEILRPDIFAKGAEYASQQIAEEPVMAALGGRVVYIPMVLGVSTTGTLERMANAQN